jgi:hypothetical protein
MPLYTFYNEETDEYVEELVSISSKEQFLKDNPHLTQVIEAPAIVSGVGGVGQIKQDSGFKDLLNRIGNANPYTPLGFEHGDKGIKATKNREAVTRQRKRQEARDKST